MAGFFDFLRMRLSWWGVGESVTADEPLCFELVVETPGFSLHDDASQFDLHGRDC